jgi:membrane protein
VLTVLVVLGPVITAAAAPYAPWVAQFRFTVTLARFTIVTLILAAAVFLAHDWLPAGRRRFREIIPGAGISVILWLLAGAAFGRYLAAFANSYVVTYDGLASVMIALVFLGGRSTPRSCAIGEKVADSQPASSRGA